MNERLLELYKQARVPDTFTDPSNNMPCETTSFSAEKFAELIIKECLTRAEFNKSIDHKEWNNAIDFVSTDIKEHLGVK